MLLKIQDVLPERLF